MSSMFPEESEGEEPRVPEGVIEAIHQLDEGRTADGDDLDDALNF